MYERLYLEHYGTKRHSGRYPWGSGGNAAAERSYDLLGRIKVLEEKGFNQKQVAEALGMNTTQLRQEKSLAKSAVKSANYSFAYRLREKGYGWTAIGERMGMNESTVRALLSPATKERKDITKNTIDSLKRQLEDKKYLDVGVGTEIHMGISRTRLMTALKALKKEGYVVEKIHVEQMGAPGQKTTVQCLCPAGTTKSELYKNRADISAITERTDDGGRSFLGLEPVRSISSDRIAVRYDEDKGTLRDGVIELRRGVDEISLGNAKYAQVRIGVDGTHYLKGMAYYSDDLPDGVDIRFNTNKSKNDPKIQDQGKLGAFKKMQINEETGKIDVDNPFGAAIKRETELVLTQRHYIDKNGKKQVSALNIVNEEGNWGEWSKTLSSQMLSKQPVPLAKKQLGDAYEISKRELDEIINLTNPVIKKKLLQSYADGADSAAVSLKAASLPRQGTHVILPLPKIKETEVFAPNYRDGEEVVLIRYPHGGIFEIPRLRVNNKNSEGKKVIGKDAIDAIGLHPKVAEQMSGADFDGDSVIVIPTRGQKVKTSPTLESLKDFDPKLAYKLPPDAPKVNSSHMQKMMGQVSNLITDMTIKGATDNEIASAVKHSMVVIDCEKHHLNYKQSYIDNGINNLKKKYQSEGGASTLISRASSEKRVNARKEGITDPKTGKRIYVDPKTGEKLYRETGETYTKTKVNKRTGEVTEKEIYRQTKTTKLADEKDAHKLSSGTVMETVYADYSNGMKSLANKARLELENTPNLKYSSSAKKVYATEVKSLDNKLLEAKANAPRERNAQILAGTIVKTKQNQNPDMDKDRLKKIKGQALAEARARTGAKKNAIHITDKEFEAIQAGAISDSQLTSIVNNSDLDRLKALATPRTNKSVSASVSVRAKSMLDSGYSTSEVADALGISTTTINKEIKK